MIRLFKKNLKGFVPQIIIVVFMVFIQSMADLYLPTLNSDITNNGIATGDIEYIKSTGVLMLAIVVISAICAVAASFFSSKTSMGFGKIVREKMFCHVETLSQGDIDEVGAASLITRATNDITQVQNALMMIMRMMLGAPIMCVGGIIMASRRSPELSWIIAVILPVIALLMLFMIKKGMPLFKSIQKKIDRVNQIIRENLNGMRVIRAFNKSSFEMERFDVANMDLTDTSLKVNRLMAVMMPSLMFIVSATNIAIVWFGGHSMVDGDLKVGDLTAFITYMMLILMSFLMSAMLFIMIPRASASAERINEVLAIEPKIHEPEEPKKTAPEIKGHLSFENVTFSYPEAEAPVLTNISFEAKPGEITAIIGGTGSGKSTLINLIPRFYDVTSGSVKIDGVDIRHLAQEDLRSRIGIVPQKAFLFRGTVAENVRFGKEAASDEEVMHALEVAQAMEFISTMEDGLGYLIAQAGSNVSGGQRQRLAIARALVKNPEIYIFDDSFSALDFKTDAKLRAALAEEIKDSTMLIVAQRVSTIMHADRIIVLEDGEIAGIGKHKELMESCSVYKEIVLSQISETEVE